MAPSPSAHGFQGCWRRGKREGAGPGGLYGAGQEVRHTSLLSTFYHPELCPMITRNSREEWKPVQEENSLANRETFKCVLDETNRLRMHALPLLPAKGK